MISEEVSAPRSENRRTLEDQRTPNIKPQKNPDVLPEPAESLRDTSSAPSEVWITLNVDAKKQENIHL